MPKAIDIAGKRFGRLTAVAPTTLRSGGHLVWKFRCSCGTIKNIDANHVRAGLTRSCGCLLKEVSSKTNFKHGEHNTTEYQTWCRIKQRCLNKRCRSRRANRCYKNVALCKRWHTYANFKKDMGFRPKDCSSIDRIDNAKGYSKSNCRWSNCKEQGENTSRVRCITYLGIGRPLASWARILGLKYATLKSRLFRYGWSVERAFTESLHREKGSWNK